MGVHIWKRGNKLYLDIYWKGMRKRKSLGLKLTSDKRQNEEILRLAEIIRSKEELRLVAEQYGIADPIRRKLSLLDYAKQLSQNLPPADHLRRLVPYLEQYKAAVLLEGVGVSYVEGFKAFLSTTGLAPQTQRHMFNALKRVLDHAVREGILEQNPAKLLRSPRVPEKAPLFLELEELQRLAQFPLQGELGKEVRRGFLFACYTGLRISDLRTLKWKDIKLEQRLLLKPQKKTGRLVSIPLHPTAWQLINPGDRIPSAEEPVFPKLATTRTTTNKILQQWAERAGIPKRIGWHTARKTYATLTLQYSGDYGTVSKLLGHSQVTITKKYAEVLDSSKRRVVNALPSLHLVP